MPNRAAVPSLHYDTRGRRHLHCQQQTAAASAALICIEGSVGGGMLFPVSAGKYIKKEIKADYAYQNTIMRSPAPTAKKRLSAPFYICIYLCSSAANFLLYP